MKSGTLRTTPSASSWRSVEPRITFLSGTWHGTFAFAFLSAQRNAFKGIWSTPTWAIRPLPELTLPAPYERTTGTVVLASALDSTLSVGASRLSGRPTSKATTAAPSFSRTCSAFAYRSRGRGYWPTADDCTLWLSRPTLRTFGDGGSSFDSDTRRSSGWTEMLIAQLPWVSQATCCV